ncbi:MAG TPA: DUF4382 domain-containing protein [Granulicella sp.]|nr:DUF4382 domain-containing protein [Granulicella sp.]
MRKAILLSSLSLGMILSLVTGCSNSTTNTAATPANSAPVSLSITDTPPAGVNVLSFEVSLTSANLMPASGTGAVSLLRNNLPIELDVTQLQTLSAFLNTANVPAGTYNSLSLTFANPKLVIYNASDASLASSCAVGTVCRLTPTIDNSATTTLSSTPFPATIAANMPLGLLVDFQLNNVIQPDLSVNLGATNGVTVSELTPTATPTPQYGHLTGTVQSINASQNQFTVQTAYGNTYTIAASSTTLYSSFPATVCTTGSIACLSAGQIVRVQITGVASGGVLTAGQVTYLQAAGMQTAEGSIVGLTTTNGTTVMKLILHGNPSNDEGLPMGGEAMVTIGAGATYSINSNGYTVPTGLTFTGASSLYVGQQVLVNVVAGSLNSTAGTTSSGTWGAPQPLTFTTHTVELEPSQFTGPVSAVNTGTSSFTLGGQWWMSPINVETGAQTVFQGFTPASFSSVTSNSVVSVYGFLFAPASGSTTPTLAAETVILRTPGM